MARETKTLRYWVKTAEGSKVWFQNGIEFLNYVKGIEVFEGGSQAMTLDEFKVLKEQR